MNPVSIVDNTADTTGSIEQAHTPIANDLEAQKTP